MENNSKIFCIEECSGIMDGWFYCDPKMSICTTVNIEHEDMIYFKVLTGDETDSRCCRISMTEPKVLDISDYTLSKEDMIKALDIVKNNWKELVRKTNYCRTDNEINSINLNLPMPDYTKLK